MRLLQIQEFSLSAAVDYSRPVVLDEAKIDSVANEIVASECGNYLNTADIALAKGDGLFSYCLTIPLFNGVGSIVITHKGITVSFKQGRTKAHLDLMIRITLRALELPICTS